MAILKPCRSSSEGKLRAKSCAADWMQCKREGKCELDRPQPKEKRSQLTVQACSRIPLWTQVVIWRATLRRRLFERAICSVFECWSYDEIIPPTFDYYDV